MVAWKYWRRPIVIVNIPCDPCVPWRTDNYVYDLYTMEDGLNGNEDNKTTDHPL